MINIISKNNINTSKKKEKKKTKAGKSVVKWNFLEK